MRGGATSTRPTEHSRDARRHGSAFSRCTQECGQFLFPLMLRVQSPTHAAFRLPLSFMDVTSCLYTVLPVRSLPAASQRTYQKQPNQSCVFCVHQVRAAVACLGMQRFEQAAHFCRRAEALVRTSNCSRGLLVGVSEARVRSLQEQAEAGMARTKQAHVLARARSKAAAWRSLGVQDALLQRRVLLGLSLSLSPALCPSGTEVSLTLARRAR